MSLDIHSSLEDLRRGPDCNLCSCLSDADGYPRTRLSVLCVPDDLAVEIPLPFAPPLHGVDLRLTGSHRILPKLLERHGDELPASVTEDAQSRLLQPPSTLTKQTVQKAGIIQEGTTPTVTVAVLSQVLNMPAAASKPRIGRF